MSNAEKFVISDGQLAGITTLMIVGLAAKYALYKIADRRHKRQIAKLNEIFSLPPYEKP